MKLCQDLFDHLSQVLDLPELTIDSDGGCSLVFDDNITVYFDYEDEIEILTLHCSLGSIDETHTATVYPLLLEANVLWAGTGGATLGVTPTDRSVILAFQERVRDLDPARFEGLLQGFLSTAEFWQDQLHQAIESSAESAREPDLSPGIRV